MFCSNCSFLTCIYVSKEAGQVVWYYHFLNNIDSILKSRDITLQQRFVYQGYGFSSGHVRKWELDCEESWALKNWCFWTVVLEKILKSHLGCKEI